MEKDLERVATELAGAISAGIKKAARDFDSEADFRREAAKLIERAAGEAGLELTPRDEHTVASGRVDSLYNLLVLEYKAPGTLRNSNETRKNREVIEQTQGYIVDVASQHKRESQRFVGVVTDGHYFVFIRRIGESWVLDEPEEVNATSTARFLRFLFALATGAALIPENLLRDFGPKSERFVVAFNALYAGLECQLDGGSDRPLVSKLFEQWKRFFSAATDYREWFAHIRGKSEFHAILAETKLDPKSADAPRVFFVLHTYYALLIKLIATLAAARFAGGAARQPFSGIIGKEGTALRDAFERIEHGGIFREYGIRNFLEADFFGWYVAAWGPEVEKAVGGLIRCLHDYDPGTLDLAPENARDLLKNLYHSILPRAVRQTLGEYYTPDWLAEHVIRSTVDAADLGDPRKRVLDPSCGSGTFLVLVIRFIRERAARNRSNPAEVLERTLQNVVGFDLNPLAVIAARTNYLLALGDLLRERTGDIDIPVYQADSVLTPFYPHERVRNGQLSLRLEAGEYRIQTVVGEFRVPTLFANRVLMEILANELDDAVESQIKPQAFLHRIRAAAGLDDDQVAATSTSLTVLHNQLRGLHDEGMNGVWARIIKNAFAPLFNDASHYIVGNPPWVNWENLPDEYRTTTQDLWRHYNLFVHSGMDTILGKGKKDISMLMTYVAADKYLRHGGRLGFVVSQSLFKSSASGQGFRQFELPDRTSLGVIRAEDMVELNPFEGATNRTAVLVFLKGKRTTYPVEYTVWKKLRRGRGSRVPFDGVYDEVFREWVRALKWHARPVSDADPTSAWITARKQALGALTKVLGNSRYSAHAGSFTGGANAVYWLEVSGARPGGMLVASNLTEGAKIKVPRIQAAVEEALVYPLLRGRDVRRWNAEPSAHILMMQDPKTKMGIDEAVVSAEYPKAYSYLRRFESVLRARRSQAVRRLMEKGPFYSIFAVGDYTFAPWKVVWREQASQFTAAVIGKADGKVIIPDHKLMLVAAASKAEAHYLCAALNSCHVRLAVAAYAVDIQMDPHVLDNIKVPKFSASNSVHTTLAKLSQRAHVSAAKGESDALARIELEIDREAAKLWKLTAEDVEEIRISLAEALS